MKLTTGERGRPGVRGYPGQDQTLESFVRCIVVNRWRNAHGWTPFEPTELEEAFCLEFFQYFIKKLCQNTYGYYEQRIYWCSTF